MSTHKINSTKNNNDDNEEKNELMAVTEVVRGTLHDQDGLSPADSGVPSQTRPDNLDEDIVTTMAPSWTTRRARRHHR
jgi:hypothetical protein